MEELLSVLGRFRRAGYNLIDLTKEFIYRQYIVSTTLKAQRKASQRDSTRINLRVRRQTKAVLVEAARLQQVKLTEFMIKASEIAAEMALADRTRFVLPPEKWRQFNAALDAEPQEIASLRKLFKEPSVFRSR
ncbi:MAG: hypothetical protein C5B50_22880 [Verrucomicrobia bacterium]|nr:MAG: hypothetical protein C5B50_22880 [Verrucomicrobiota bacterium]